MLPVFFRNFGIKKLYLNKLLFPASAMPQRLRVEMSGEDLWHFTSVPLFCGHMRHIYSEVHTLGVSRLKVIIASFFRDLLVLMYAIKQIKKNEIGGNIQRLKPLLWEHFLWALEEKVKPWYLPYLP